MCNLSPTVFWGNFLSPKVKLAGLYSCKRENLDDLISLQKARQEGATDKNEL